jgi:hypothetical protein
MNKTIQPTQERLTKLAAFMGYDHASHPDSPEPESEYIFWRNKEKDMAVLRLSEGDLLLALAVKSVEKELMPLFEHCGTSRNIWECVLVPANADESIMAQASSPLEAFCRAVEKLP